MGNPFVPKLKASYENVEKVVKPPQKPTTKKGFIQSGKLRCLWNIPIRIPNRKHPKILMVKVASGKGAFHTTKKSLLIRNLQDVPINPPAPANNINFHIIIGITYL